MLRSLLALILLAASACASVPASAPAAAQPNYYVMRHLQKASGPDPALSEEGKLSADKLADLLANDHVAAIYVSTTRRAWETAAPLAARLGLTMKTYNPADTPALIAAVAAETATVLIVGHSNTVPEIVERLGGARPADLGETDYGDIWHIYGPDRRVEKLRLAP
jgi:broad specificity phosphatase PhoE